MSVAEELWECDVTIRKFVVSVYDALIVGIGYDPGLVLYYFHPLCLWTHDDTGALEEECFFLHTAAVGHHQSRVLLHECHLEERKRFKEMNQRIVFENAVVFCCEFIAGAGM